MNNNDRSELDHKKFALFAMFAATRSVLFGAGALLPGAHYSISQRIPVIEKDYGGETTRNRPLVNSRNEPLADSRFVRVHDISNDPHMNPWASRVQLGAGSLVLRLIENDIALPDLRFKAPLFMVARDIAKDPSLSARFRLQEGGSASALDIQKAINNAAQKLSAEIDLSDEEKWTLDEWEKALFDLQQDPRLTVDRVEWVMKQKVLERIQKKHGWGWNSQMMRYKDRQFSEITTDSIGMALRETEWAKYMPDKDLIDDRIINPPNTTRAQIRGRFIQKVQSRPDIKPVISWSTIKVRKKTHHLDDPYQVKSAAINRMKL